MTDFQMRAMLNNIRSEGTSGHSFQTILDQAKDGSASACSILGQYFYNEHDYAQSATWYRKGAELGDPVSQYFLSVLMEVGAGIAMDAEQANSWLLRSAECGFPYAQLKFGINCVIGKGVQKDNAMAHTWLAKAAASSNSDSEIRETASRLLRQLNDATATKPARVSDETELNSLFSSAEKGDPKAFKEIVNLAVAGNPSAQLQLGRMFHLGDGVLKNLEEAELWYVHAAAQGETVAQMNLQSIDPFYRNWDLWH